MKFTLKNHILEESREERDLETNKIVTNKVNANKDHFFKFNVIQTRGHQYKLSKPMSTKLVRSKCFSHRVANDWNSLSQVPAQTVNEFTEKIDNYWKDQQYKSQFD